MTSSQQGTIVCIRHKGRPYSHWCVLDGGSGCIHVNKKRNMITLDPLEKVLRNSVKVDFIIEDDETRMRNWERASSQIGRPYKYGLITSNCENWVNEIRYGESTSHQVGKIAVYISMLSLLLF